jgi:lipoprotein-releasing system permease protein
MIFLIQGYYLAFLGILIGNVVAFILSYLQLKFGIITLPETIYYLSKAPIAINWRNYVLVSGITFVLCALTSFLPSYIAARISPLTSLRFD